MHTTGRLSQRRELDAAGAVVSWVRFEGEGLHPYRTDEKYDSDADGSLTELDGWRVARVTYNGAGQIGHILREDVYQYANNQTGTADSSMTVVYHYDPLGNVMGLTDEDGSAVATFETTAFGEPVGAFDGSLTNRRITGKWRDAVTGLDYFEARWYDAEVGRFVGRAELPSDQEQPFALAESNPVMLIDPTGMEPVPTPAPCDIKGLVDSLYCMSPNRSMGYWYRLRIFEWTTDVSQWLKDHKHCYHHTHESAIRHCLAQCIIQAKCKGTIKGGLAKFSGDYHEYCQYNGDYNDTLADLHNNTIGRCCGHNKWGHNCLTCCLCELNKGNLSLYDENNKSWNLMYADYSNNTWGLDSWLGCMGLSKTEDYYGGCSIGWPVGTAWPCFKKARSAMWNNYDECN